jgi:DNA-binding NtrC family response regulator
VPEYRTGRARRGDREQPFDVSILLPGMSLAELERMAILHALETAKGSTAKAAELLDVSQRKIQYRLKEWGMTAVAGGDDDDE